MLMAAVVCICSRRWLDSLCVLRGICAVDSVSIGSLCAPLPAMATTKQLLSNKSELYVSGWAGAGYWKTTYGHSSSKQLICQNTSAWKLYPPKQHSYAYTYGIPSSVNPRRVSWLRLGKSHKNSEATKNYFELCGHVFGPCAHIRSASKLSRETAELYCWEKMNSKHVSSKATYTS